MNPQPTPASPARARQPKAPRRRLSSEDRRQQLLDHAIELFSQHGFSGTRTRDIAAACGVSEGILFRHFATKEDLYHAILDAHEGGKGAGGWLAGMKRLAEENDDEGLVRSLVAQLVKSFREETAFHRLMMYARLEGHSLVDIFHERMGLPAFDFLRSYMVRRQKEGAFRGGDPGAMVMLLFSPAIQYSMSKYLFGKDVFRLPDREMVEEITRFTLAGLREPKRRAPGKRARS